MGLWQDIAFGFRQIKRAPVFASTCIAVLAVGIAANTAIFGILDATLLRPLPFSHPDNLVALRTRYPDGRVTTGLVAAAELMTRGLPPLAQGSR